jgi:hypothetical protein
MNKIISCLFSSQENLQWVSKQMSFHTRNYAKQYTQRIKVYLQTNYLKRQYMKDVTALKSLLNCLGCENVRTFWTCEWNTDLKDRRRISIYLNFHIYSNIYAMKGRSIWVLIKLGFEQSSAVVTDSKLVPSYRMLNSRHVSLNSTTKKVCIHDES